MKYIVTLLLFFSSTLFSSELVKLDTRDGVTQQFELIKAENPVASIILFAGGHGVLNLSLDGDDIKYGWGKVNFLVRIRNKLVENGFNVAVVDAPSDKQDKNGMLYGFREGLEHQEDIDKVINYLKEKFSVPVWLAGTSRGTESAASIAINTEVGIRGLILTSSMTVENPRGNVLPKMELSEIKVPVYIAAHKNDNCEHTPSSGAEVVKNLLTNAKNIKVDIFEGGKEVAKPCQAKTYHGFLGIENQVIDGMTNYIKSNL